MKLVSAVFHPLLLATYLMSVLFFTAPELLGTISIRQIPLLIGVTFVTTFLIPAACIGVMRLSSKVSNLELTNRDERLMPFLSITMFYAATTYMFINQFRFTGTFALMMITVTVLIFSLLLITTKFKVSIHASANWGGVGLLTFLLIKVGATLLFPLLGAILVAGTVSTSRLYLGYHTPREIWVGTFYGFSFCFFSLLLFQWY